MPCNEAQGNAGSILLNGGGEARGRGPSIFGGACPADVCARRGARKASAPKQGRRAPLPRAAARARPDWLYVPVRAVRAFRRRQRGKMAAERTDAAASGPGDYASWAPAELRHCLGGIGAAVHGNGSARGRSGAAGTRPRRRAGLIPPPSDPRPPRVPQGVERSCWSGCRATACRYSAPCRGRTRRESCCPIVPHCAPWMAVSHCAP